MKKTIVGIRPTGKLHIGHYLSVIKPALEYKADVLIADLHTPGGGINPDLKDQLVSFGISRKKIIIQSQRYADEIMLLLFTVMLDDVRLGELKRMTQFKSAPKSEQTAHLLIYPILMAFDVGGYDCVVVGDDQKQHSEFIHRHFFPDIKFIFTGKIMNLSNPEEKMSKSASKGCLFLDDDFQKKLMGAATTKEGIQNLKNLSKQFNYKYNENNNEKSKTELAKIIEEEINRQT